MGVLNSAMQDLRRMPGAIWIAVLLLFLPAAVTHAAVPGIVGTSFSLVAGPNYLTQPDGQMVYSWGYGCAGSVQETLVGGQGGACPLMQVPGPTLIVTEGQHVTVTLTNNLPGGSGNTSIIFPGFQVAATGGSPGILTTEAAPGNPVTYSFTASTPGTHSYYSGTQSDLQIEMGLYGALIVLPSSPATCTRNANNGATFSLSSSAYDTAASCYDREYLFQFSEMDAHIHRQVEAQLMTIAACNSTTTQGCPTSLSVTTEPYHPSYFMINGRSMPDDMDANFAPPYPNQPYNGNPHMHPGDLVLLRVIGQGRWQHPFHEHGNHVRVLARDGNLLLSQTDKTKLAGPLLFTTTTTPGLSLDGIFYWTGKGLNWDVYDHTRGDGTVCTPDADGYYTQASGAPLNAPNYGEWCADHDRPLETQNGGPATLPDPLILTNGLWYGGSPYLGPVATTKSMGATPLPPGSSVQNPNAGFAFMWHSHNEREITTNDVFPGGMMMMMIVDAPYVVIDENL